MIRVVKTDAVPASLQEEGCSKYDGQDVQEALVFDQDAKCYLCEQYTGKTFNVEHLKAKTLYPDLKYTWTNLFLSCPYCNGRKPNNYDILDPMAHNIEDLITHHLDLSAKSIVIETLRVGPQEDFTVRLLRKLFNGENNIRDIKGGLLYKDLEREFVFFLGLLDDYSRLKTQESKQKVIDNLLITKEFLAFKYWFIRGNETIYDDFKEEMTWNKTE